MAEEIIIKPQPGFQRAFCSSPADVVVGGGAGFAGKSFGLLMDSARGVISIDGKPRYPGYNAVIFRKFLTEIKIGGGLWDDSMRIFPHIGGSANETSKAWWFEDSRSEIAFKQLAREAELVLNKGQFAYIGWDEMADFVTFKMFTYMLSRNRTACGMRPKTRGTCNPDPDSFLAEFMEWYINQDTGFPIPERAGVIRYFAVDEDRPVWGNTRQEVYDKTRHIFSRKEFEGYDIRDLIKSFTFIPGTIADNKIGTKSNPAVMANMAAQSEEEKLRLLYGNWKIRVDGTGLYEWDKLDDMFSGHPLPPEPRRQNYISIDHAWAGKDLCVIGTWQGWACVRIDIITKNNTDKWRNDLILQAIRMSQAKFPPIPPSNMIIDQDGVGVRDVLHCNIFQGHMPPTERIVPPADRNKEFDVHLTPRTYKNKKTQCAFKLADKVNNGLITIDLDNVYIWENGKGPQLCANGIFKHAGKTIDLRRRIKEEFRSVKREKIDYEGRKEITPKEKQKNALGGTSPDFYDMINIRTEMDFVRKPVYLS
jgi:hypothetical protein